MGRPRKPLDETTWEGRFSVRLLKLWRARFDSESAFADALSDAGHSVSVHTIRKWSNGSRLPTTESLPAIAEALELPVREVLPET